MAATRVDSMVSDSDLIIVIIIVTIASNTTLYNPLKPHATTAKGDSIRTKIC